MDPNDPQATAVRVAQLYLQALMTKMMDSCHEKCVSKHYHQADMEIAETSCSDRCVEKYIKVYSMVNQRLGLEQPSP